MYILATTLDLRSSYYRYDNNNTHTWKGLGATPPGIKYHQLICADDISTT